MCASESKTDNQQIPPFNIRFNIPIEREKVVKAFVNRIWNGIVRHFPDLVVSPPGYYHEAALVHVANVLGVIRDKSDGFDVYGIEAFWKGGLYDFLQSTEALYQGFKLYYRNPDENLIYLDNIIINALSLSEIDIGIEWKNGVFLRKGAKLLDENLINITLEWLQNPEYHNVLEPFQKGLKLYLEAVQDESKLSDTITDMFESLEALARIICNNDGGFSANIPQFVSELKLSNQYDAMLRNYAKYAHDYRHAAKKDEQRMPPNPNEVEAFLYMTGLFIRLAIKQSELNEITS